MKKILSVFVMFCLMFGVVGVLADSQTVGGDVLSFIEFNLASTDVDYGSVNPGSDSSPVANNISVTENNNVNFSVDIKLTADPSTLFVNLFFDLDTSTSYEATEQLDEILVFPITNQPTAFTATVNSILRVPAGFSPVTDATGTITYTITGLAP